MREEKFAKAKETKEQLVGAIALWRLINNYYWAEITAEITLKDFKTGTKSLNNDKP